MPDCLLIKISKSDVFVNNIFRFNGSDSQSFVDRLNAFLDKSELHKAKERRDRQTEIKGIYFFCRFKSIVIDV